MKTRHLVTMATLFVASAAAFADQVPGNDAPLTRAEVRQSVVDARNAGQLRPAGEAGDYPYTPVIVKSSLTRSEVRHDVIEARAAGTLIPAGEDGDTLPEGVQPVSASGLTRAEVKAATLQARDDGQLIPAGDLDGASLAREQAQAAYARTKWLARHPAPVVASGK